jgi:hypothetical protein
MISSQVNSLDLTMPIVDDPFDVTFLLFRDLFEFWVPRFILLTIFLIQYFR